MWGKGDGARRGNKEEASEKARDGVVEEDGKGGMEGDGREGGMWGVMWGMRDVEGGCGGGWGIGGWGLGRGWEG